MAANILIIIVAGLLGFAIVQKTFFNTPATINQPARVQPAIGSKINLPNLELASEKQTLILALQKGCRFCSESMPFYKRIAETVQDGNTRLIAVLPGSAEESSRYLGEFGLNNIVVEQATLDSLQVSGTPTLILINNKGEITDYWVGKLPPDKEIEVLDKLKS